MEERYGGGGDTGCSFAGGRHPPETFAVPAELDISRQYSVAHLEMMPSIAAHETEHTVRSRA